MEHMVLSVASRALVEACKTLGLPANELLAKSNIKPEQLDDADALIPASAADQLWQTAYQVSGDPLLSLHAVEALPFGAYRVIDYLASTAPTVGEGISNVLNYFPLVDSRVQWCVSKTNQSHVLDFQSSVPGMTIPAPAQEFTFAAILLRSRQGTRIPWIPKSVHFTFPEPQNLSEYYRMFGEALLFNEPDPRMVVSNEFWKTRSLGADLSLHAVLEDHAQHLFKKRPKPGPLLSDKVCEHIRQTLNQGTPSMSDVAKAMGMSAKTLQRRLKEDEKSFGNLLEQVRQSDAQLYLADRSIAMAEVAWLLGFSEQSAFTRAFKRWTGKSPGKWRLAL